MSRARDNANLGAQAGSGLDASDITTGVLPVGVTGGSGLNALSASNLSAGVVPDARMPNLTGDVTTVEGAVATTIATDAVDIAMLSATGTASSSTFLRGDNSWQTAGSPSIVDNGNATAMTIDTSEDVTFTGNIVMPINKKVLQKGAAMISSTHQALILK